MKRAAAVFLITFLFVDNIYAEIGKSVKDFQNSAFTKAETVKQYDAWRIGKTAIFYFNDPPKRYLLQLKVDLDKNYVIEQSLDYLTPDNQTQADTDIAFMIKLLEEATGNRIEPKKLSDLVIAVFEKALRTKKPQTEEIKGYKITIGARSNSINVCVNKG